MKDDICEKCGHDAVNHFDENGKETRCKYVIVGYDPVFPKSSRFCDCPELVKECSWCGGIHSGGPENCK